MTISLYIAWEALLVHIVTEKCYPILKKMVMTEYKNVTIMPSYEVISSNERIDAFQQVMAFLNEVSVSEILSGFKVPAAQIQAFRQSESYQTRCGTIFEALQLIMEKTYFADVPVPAEFYRGQLGMYLSMPVSVGTPLTIYSGAEVA